MVVVTAVPAAVAAMFANDYAGYADVAARAVANVGASSARVRDDIGTQHGIDALCVGLFALMALVLLGTVLRPGAVPRRPPPR